MNIGDIIRHIATFFEGLLQTISTAKFATTSSVIVALLFGLIAIAGLFREIFKWITLADKGSGIAEGVVSFGQFAGKKVLLWVAIGITPVMFSSISSSTLKSVSGLISEVSGPAQSLLNMSWTAITTIWSSQGAIQSNLASEWPGLLDGLEPGTDQDQDAAIVKDNLERMKKVAIQAVASQKVEGKKLAESSDPAKKAKGQRLLAEAQAQERKIQTATQIADLQKGQAEAAVAADADQPFFDGRIFGGVMSLGMSEIILLIKRMFAGVIGFLCVAIPLIFALLMAWKLIQSIISLFSHLAIYAGCLALAAALSQVLGPLAILSFGSGKTDRYGHSFVSFWLQAVIGSSALVASVKIVSVAIGALSGVIASTSFGVYSTVLATKGLGETMVAGAVAGLGFMAASYAVEFFIQFVQKAPTVGAGLVSGSFHP